jgi:hypothetical protein
MDNPISLLLSSHLNLETDNFFHLHLSEILSSFDSPKALSRFKVKTVNVKKKKESPQHEFILIDVYDTQDCRDRLFILERTVNMDDEERSESDDSDKQKNIVERFLQHPDSKAVVDAILQSLVNIPPTVVVAGAAMATGQALSGLSAPVVASAIIPLAVASKFLPSPPSPSQVSSSYLPYASDPIMEPSHTSMVDQATLNVTQVLHFISELTISRQASKKCSNSKPPKDAIAHDRWIAGHRVEDPDYGTVQGARSFNAYNLSLFHLALLAYIVHEEEPLYTVFKNNCYWFSNTFYLAARIIDKTLANRPDLPEDPEDPRTITDMFYLPFYLYMPEVAGRWMGFKIFKVQEIVLNRIVKSFLQRLSENEKKVLYRDFTNSYLLQLTNFLTDYTAQDKSVRAGGKSVRTEGKSVGDKPLAASIGSFRADGAVGISTVNGSRCQWQCHQRHPA